MSKSLSTLPFVDLYLRIDQPDEARFHPHSNDPRMVKNQIVPIEYAEDLERLRISLNGVRKDELSLIHDTVRLRVSRQRLANGQSWAALRRVSPTVPTLEALNFFPKLIPHLQGLGKRSGLVIIAGATGHGKTTTANAMIADFLQKQGGVGYTLEDPVEYLLQGNHGKGGYCFQVEIDRDDDWAPRLRTALRWHPRYLLVGEVRSPEAANQVIRAATSGHLVITTMHAGSVEEALNSLIQISESSLGSRAPQLLADGLVCVLHQTLRSWGPYCKFIFTDKDNPADPARVAVRENNTKLLGTYIAQQEAQIIGDAHQSQRD